MQFRCVTFVLLFLVYDYEATYRVVQWDIYKSCLILSTVSGFIRNEMLIPREFHVNSRQGFVEIRKNLT